MYWYVNHNLPVRIDDHGLSGWEDILKIAEAILPSAAGVVSNIYQSKSALEQVKVSAKMQLAQAQMEQQAAERMTKEIEKQKKLAAERSMAESLFSSTVSSGIPLIGGMQTSTLLLLGGGIVALIFILRR